MPRIVGTALLVLIVMGPVARAQRQNPGPSPRPEPVFEASLNNISALTSGEREDDHPAIAARGGRVWTAWVSYSGIEGAAHIFARALENGRWAEPVRVTESAGDYHKPAITVDEAGNVWVAWAAQAAGNWDIFGRRHGRSGWSRIERWTEHQGPDLLPALASGGGRVLLVWQGLRRNHFDILYRVARGDAWGGEGFVSESPAHDWEPVVAAAGGAFHVAWDSFRGDYDVFLRSLRGDTWGAELAVASTARLENHAALSVDHRQRLWISWEIGPERWAGDSANGGLRARRDIGLACLDNGRLFRAPEAEAALAKLGAARGLQAPLVAAGRDGVLRAFFRQPVNNNWLVVGMTSWEEGGWKEPEKLPYSEGRIDQRIVAADTGDRIVIAFPAGSSHNVIYARSWEVGPPGSREGVPALTPADPASAKSAPPAPARHSLSGYQLVWGDLHRHTDISEDGGIIDGSLIDAMRYSLDAAGLDFLGVTDHTRYLPRRYNLWRIQQLSDVFYGPGLFVPVHAYERSQYSPWGHRNVVHLRRDYEPVPASYDIGDPGVSPTGLFAALRGKQAITIPHTSAWANKQVSWDYWDPEIERVVEIYQGLRSTYEYNGAPDPADRAIYEKDSRNFVWDALARGHKMGFIASSDHRSTHMSYAAVWVRRLDREGVFEGLHARRTYAATDKILVEMTLAGAMMGEEVAVAGTPELQVGVEGTANLARVDIVKNGTFVYTAQPAGRSARFTFRDENYAGEAAYYYARVIQADKNMAWGSPIWVRRRN